MEDVSLWTGARSVGFGYHGDCELRTRESPGDPLDLHREVFIDRSDARHVSTSDPFIDDDPPEKYFSGIC
jgi:hypothetical protein